jgi:hypothetical protein
MEHAVNVGASCAGAGFRIDYSIGIVCRGGGVHDKRLDAFRIKIGMRISGERRHAGDVVGMDLVLSAKAAAGLFLAILFPPLYSNFKQHNVSVVANNKNTHPDVFSGFRHFAF